VYDVDAAAQSSPRSGCPAAGQLQEVTKLSDVVITVVTDDKAMKNIYNGGLLSRARGKLFINCATSRQTCMLVGG
jgi:3-hydroxyisobutyrate dehydrogenase-like beta-hydroxyacid dehydrogenase